LHDLGPFRNLGVEAGSAAAVALSAPCVAASTTRAWPAMGAVGGSDLS
jgi:hypothetical protein